LSSTLFNKPFSTKVDCNEHMTVSDINHMIGCPTHHESIRKMPMTVTKGMISTSTNMMGKRNTKDKR
jgi:hypothetical protein